MDSNVFLKVQKPLYGISESGLHWYLTYVEHHLDRLGMDGSMVDPCLFVKKRNGNIEGVIVIQVDDSLGIGGPYVLQSEEQTAANFKRKPLLYLGETPVVFKGLTIRQKPDGKVTLHQTEKIERLTSAAEQKSFASTCALAQYIGVHIRTDICAPVQLIAPGNRDITPEEYKILDKVVRFLKDTKDIHSDLSQMI